MTVDEPEIITLKREDRIDKENENKPEQAAEPKIAFKRIVICPFPPELGLMPDIMERIVSHHESINNDQVNARNDNAQQKAKQHTHKTHRPTVQIINDPTNVSQHMNSSTNNYTYNNQTDTNINSNQFITDTAAIKSLMSKYYVLLACLIILITTASLICLKMKNIRAQVINFMKTNSQEVYK